MLVERAKWTLVADLHYSTVAWTIPRSDALSYFIDNIGVPSVPSCFLSLRLSESATKSFQYVKLILNRTVPKEVQHGIRQLRYKHPSASPLARMKLDSQPDHQLRRGRTALGQNRLHHRVLRRWKPSWMACGARNMASNLCTC